MPGHAPQLRVVLPGGKIPAHCYVGIGGKSGHSFHFGFDGGEGDLFSPPYLIEQRYPFLPPHNSCQTATHHVLRVTPEDTF